MKFLINFFQKLQNKPKATRKRWLWFFVLLTLSLVLVFWINSFEKNLRPPSEKPPEQVGEEKLSFWKIFQLGLANLYQTSLKPLIENFVEKLVVVFSLIFHYLASLWQSLKLIF